MTAEPAMNPVKRITGLPYECMMMLRRKCYNAGFFKSTSVEVPVICVGNITTGGTGKTPMVSWVTNQLKQKGMSPAILTRGYKSVGDKSDEAMLLESLTGVEVVVNPSRVDGAKAAIAKGANILVMDDGFQHLKLRRDINIVLIDASNPFGGGGCLPLGRLREHPDVLRFAHAIVITRSDAIEGEKLEKLKHKLATYCDCPIATAIHKPSQLRDLNDQCVTLESVKDKKAWLFCGLGNPGAFEKTAKDIGLNVLRISKLSDHTHYDSATISKIRNEFKNSGAELLITTSKDGVKLVADSFGDTNVWQLDIEMELLENADFLDKLI